MFDHLQGKEDEFLKSEQLLPENFLNACAESKVPVILRMQEVIIVQYVLCSFLTVFCLFIQGYDHSYYFISTFMSDHIAHHAKYLKA